MDLNLHAYEGHSEGQGQKESNFSTDGQSFIKYVGMLTNSDFLRIFFFIGATFLYCLYSVSVNLWPLQVWPEGVKLNVLGNRDTWGPLL